MVQFTLDIGSFTQRLETIILSSARCFVHVAMVMGVCVCQGVGWVAGNKPVERNNSGQFDFMSRKTSRSIGPS